MGGLTGQDASSHLDMHELWKLWLHTVVRMPLMCSSKRSEGNRGRRKGQRTEEVQVKGKEGRNGRT